MNIDIFHESKSEFRQNVSAINLGRHNRQLKDVWVEHLGFDIVIMSTFEQYCLPPTYFPMRRGVHSTKIDFSTMYPLRIGKCVGG